MIRSVLLDLDGTLVHSAPGILASFRKVLGEAGITPVETVDERVIGPPLMTTLRRLSGLGDGPQLQAIAATFRDTYDTHGVLNTQGYPGLIETLQALGKSRDSYVVTNKRIVPSRLIADRLGMTILMKGVYSPDALDPPAPNKAAVVAHVLRVHETAAEESVLVGDSVEDAEAAASHGMRFIAVSYGYGSPLDFTKVAPAATLDRLAALPAVLARLD